MSRNTELVTQIAEQISVGSEARILGEAGEIIGTVYIAEAVVRDEPFFVHLQPDLLGVDFDHSDAEQAAAELYCTLRLQGLLPVRVASGQPGHEHVYCRITDPQVMNAVEAQARELARGSGGGIKRSLRPPFTASAKRRGSRARPLHPSDGLEVLKRLAQRSPARKAPNWLMERIATPPVEVEDRSAHIYGITCELIKLGWVEDEVFMLVTCRAFGVGEVFAERQQDRRVEQAKWFRRYVWPGAIEATGGGEASMLRAEFDQMWTQAARRRWPPRKGPTRRKTYEALIRLAARAETRMVMVDLRTLMDEAQIGSINTVRQALEDLNGMGLVRTVNAAARKYRHQTGLYELATVERSPDGPEALLEQGLVDSSVFRARTGLGHHAYVIYCQIIRQPLPQTVEEIRKEVGMARSTVYKHLNVLKDYGMVLCQEGRWGSGDRTEQEVVADLPSAENAKQRSLRVNAQQRELHDEFQNEWQMRKQTEDRTPRRFRR